VCWWIGPNRCNTIDTYWAPVYSTHYLLKVSQLLWASKLSNQIGYQEYHQIHHAIDKNAKLQKRWLTLDVTFYLCNGNAYSMHKRENSWLVYN
jgi:hypothetical protein